MSALDERANTTIYRRRRAPAGVGALTLQEKRRLAAAVGYGALVVAALLALSPVLRVSPAPATPAAAPVEAAKKTPPRREKPAAAEKKRDDRAAPTRSEPREEHVLGVTAAGKVPPAGGTYEVETGDTLSAIAGELGTTVETLLQLNPGVDPYALHAGQELRVP